MQVSDPITSVNTLAERVAWARERSGLSQQELADRAGVSQGTIGNIESGARKRPRDLLAIARALGVAAEWLNSGKGLVIDQPTALSVQENIPAYGVPVPTQAHQVTPVPFTTPPSFTWGELEKMEHLPALFVIQMPDGSLSGHIEEGASLIFSTELAPRAGKTVLIEDRSGERAVRVYTVLSGTRWQAHARAPGYMALDSEEHGLRVLATLKWRED